MLTIRTATQIRTAAGTPAMVPFERAYEVGRVKGYLRGKVLPVRSIHGVWNSGRYDHIRALDDRIVAVANLVSLRLQRELGA